MRTKLTETGPGISRVLDYGYDTAETGQPAKPKVYRLTSEKVNGGTPTLHTYDAVGNRTALNGAVTHYDVRDQIDNDTDAGTISTLFDANGNTTGNGRAYDYENRLVTQTSPVSVTIVYDADGHRVQKSAGGVTTYYLVDELNPTGYAQVLAGWIA